jgi:hypothetical protein
VAMVAGGDAGCARLRQVTSAIANPATKTATKVRERQAFMVGTSTLPGTHSRHSGAHFCHGPGQPSRNAVLRLGPNPSSQTWPRPNSDAKGVSNSRSRPACVSRTFLVRLRLVDIDLFAAANKLSRQDLSTSRSSATQTRAAGNLASAQAFVFSYFIISCSSKT